MNGRIDLYDLKQLRERRERVRSRINKLMKNKNYGSDDRFYKEVSALTGLEVYLTYCIEEYLRRVNEIHPEDI